MTNKGHFETVLATCIKVRELGNSTQAAEDMLHLLHKSIPLADSETELECHIQMAICYQHLAERVDQEEGRKAEFNSYLSLMHGCLEAGYGMLKDREVSAPRRASLQLRGAIYHRLRGAYDRVLDFTQAMLRSGEVYSPVFRIQVFAEYLLAKAHLGEPGHVYFAFADEMDKVDALGLPSPEYEIVMSGLCMQRTQILHMMEDGKGARNFLQEASGLAKKLLREHEYKHRLFQVNQLATKLNIDLMQ